MRKIKIKFMTIVLRFIYDWYINNGMEECDNVNDLQYLIDECEEELEAE